MINVPLISSKLQNETNFLVKISINNNGQFKIKLLLIKYKFTNS
jgi:hypothetical protein